MGEIPRRHTCEGDDVSPELRWSGVPDGARSLVLILDDPDTIRRKLKRAVTDSGSEVRYDWDDKPGVSNLIEMLSLFTGSPIGSIEAEYGDAGYGTFKSVVAEAVIEGLAAVRRAYRDLDDADVDRIMRKGALDARTKAEGFQAEVREKVGLVG